MKAIPSILLLGLLFKVVAKDTLVAYIAGFLVPEMANYIYKERGGK